MINQPYLLVTLALAAQAAAQAVTSTASSMATMSTQISGAPSMLSVFANPDNPSNEGYVVSIIDADACDTTFALRCASSVCNPSGGPAPKMTITQNPSEQIISSTVSTLGGTASGSADCKLADTTAMVCFAALSVSVDGTSTQITTTLTVTPVEYIIASITAGARKLTAASGSCTTSPSVTLPSVTSPGAAAPTAALGSVVYKVVVPVGLMAGVVAMI